LGANRAKASAISANLANSLDFDIN